MSRSKGEFSSVLLRILPSVLLALLVPGAVFAAENADRFTPYVVASSVHDSNVFRYPDSGLLETKLETRQMDDVITQIGAGFVAHIPLSRQELQLSGRAQQTSFQNFDFLDYTGGNFKAEWDWQTVNRVSGVLGGNYERNLSRTIDGQGTTKNDIREGKTAFASARYQFHSSWSVGTAFRHEVNSHDLLSQTVYDNQYDQIELNTSYLSRAQTEFTPYVRYTDVDYPNRSTDASGRFDNRYHDVQLGAKGIYRPADFVEFSGEFGGLRRVHKHIGERDANGWIGSFTVDYALTSKLAFGSSAFQKIDPIEETLADYINVNGVDVSLDWAFSERIVARGNVAYEQRDYHGQPLGDNTRRLDDVVSASLRGSYSPIRNLSLSLGVSGERRKSNLYAANYEYLNSEVAIQFSF